MSSENSFINAASTDQAAPVANPLDSKTDPTFAQPAVTSWKDALDEDIKNDPSLAVFKDVKGLAKSYVHAQKMIGADKVAIPPKSATPEEWSAFYTKIGLPSRDKYALSEDVTKMFDKGVLDSLTDAAHKQGILPGQLQDVLSTFVSTTSGMVKDKHLAEEASFKKMQSDFKAELGDKFDSTIRGANLAAGKFLSKEEIAHVEKSGLGGDPVFVKLLSRIHDSMKEDSFKEEVRSSYALSKEEAISKANSMMKDPDYFNKNSARHQGLVAEVQKLFAMTV